MRIAVLWKRRYMGHDVIRDRYARLYELPRGLAESGHAVLALCLNYHPGEPERRVDQVDSPGSLVWVGFQAGPWLVGGLPGYWRSLIAELQAFQPDVLLGGSDAPHVILTRNAAKRLGVPYVLDLYDNYEAFGLARIPGMKSLYRRALRGASGIGAVSELLAEYVQTLAPGVPAITLESTIDPARFYPRDPLAARERFGLPPMVRLVGVSGSLSRNRGIDHVYASFLRLSAEDPSLHLALAGDIDPRHPPPRHPRIHWLGRIAHDAMPDFFSALDLAVVPMIDTAFGRYAFPQKAFEILACGTPLLTTRLGALERTLAAYPECLYAPGDDEDLDRRLRGQLSEPTVLRVSIPSWRDQAGRLEQLLADAVLHTGLAACQN
ncbi:glycosyl transferase group 1 [Thiocapsa marina 5811]|uniref:Glycosyl transferase group 1 n=2 Tax=Thiocapsa marina TaxID=244573 RepID=F9UEX3_9GAMM|nr:glycosyl transferase group 1 [Thiocapsa marina 5811]